MVHRLSDSSHGPSGTSAATPPLARFRPRWRDGDVLVALLALWLASVVRVVGAGIRHEVFGAEATLAFMSVVLVPCIFFRARPRTPGQSQGLPPEGAGVRASLRLVGKDRRSGAKIG